VVGYKGITLLVSGGDAGCGEGRAGEGEGEARPGIGRGGEDVRRRKRGRE
jgi:hypothetical protein